MTERRRVGVPASSTFSSSFCIRRDFKHRALWSVRFPPRPIKAPAPLGADTPTPHRSTTQINIPLPHYSTTPIRRHATTPTRLPCTLRTVNLDMVFMKITDYAAVTFHAKYTTGHPAL